ncbi:uncharacterized protein DS421_9g274070 [Arachis hypogaea]|nr:uncharacterized protein DS421_9g274070 [Arachis hypogaea]
MRMDAPVKTTPRTEWNDGLLSTVLTRIRRSIGVVTTMLIGTELSNGSYGSGSVGTRDHSTSSVTLLTDDGDEAGLECGRNKKNSMVIF